MAILSWLWLRSEHNAWHSEGPALESTEACLWIQPSGHSYLLLTTCVPLPRPTASCSPRVHIPSSSLCLCQENMMVQFQRSFYSTLECEYTTRESSMSIYFHQQMEKQNTSIQTPTTEEERQKWINHQQFIQRNPPSRRRPNECLFWGRSNSQQLLALCIGE